MTLLSVVAAARAFGDGQAIRVANYCHRELVARPLALVAFQLGSEPFTVAAIAFGQTEDAMHLVVPGEPRNRDIAFHSLLEFADWFIPLFENPYSLWDHSPGTPEGSRAVAAPQVVAANLATVEMLGRLGRRLAYLPEDGARAADPRLVRLGQHLLFLADHFVSPGQQLLIALTDLLRACWATPQSDFERQSLAALDAYIAPGSAEHGFTAASAAQLDPVGPMPSGNDDRRLEPLMRAFNEARDGHTDPAFVSSLLGPIVEHYRPLVVRTWRLVWRCLRREQAWPQAPSVARRWQEDHQAYVRHMDWLRQGGRRRTRQTARQATMTLRRLERAQERLLAEEACDDALRMIPSLLANKAVEGRVVHIDTNYRELAAVKIVRRALVTLLSPDACPMPRGRKLWWAAHPHGAPWVVHDIVAGDGGAALVTLKLTTSTLDHLPSLGSDGCFSTHHIDAGWLPILPQIAPWTHEPPPSPPVPDEIEDGQPASPPRADLGRR